MAESGSEDERGTQPGVSLPDESYTATWPLLRDGRDPAANTGHKTAAVMSENHRSNGCDWEPSSLVRKGK